MVGMNRALDWDSGDLRPIPSSAAGLLNDLGQVTSPLCASVSPLRPPL